MAYSKSIIPSSFIIIFSWVFVGLSHGIELDKNLLGALFADNGENGGILDMPCVKKLMPCQAALTSHSKNPPATCCVPLKEIITSDAQCLCTVFGNADLMKSFNVTKDEALSFAKACGAKPDLSLCKNDSSSSNKTASPPAANAASVTSKFGGFVAVASFMILVMSAF
ncbi:non-specific lipid transfer protein GPI-anchored 3 [Nicotiana tomentosiformis]|uniref:non-specific lipid transfer protein GPI-anchored 3 n=1 Tax=Nicotiana tomentosiformis TaxID=4098 RepID=UPI00388C8C94